MKIICVLTNDSIKEQISKIKKFHNLIYAIEIRIDTFYPNDLKLAEKLIVFIRNKLPKVKIILTFRKFEEGGKIKITEAERKAVIKQLILQFKSFFDFIDIEFNSTIRDEIKVLAQKNKKNIIFSTHFLENFKEKQIYDNLNKISIYLKSKKIKKYLVKVVANMDDFSKYFETLRKIYKIFKSNSVKNYTFFTTGKTSLISRCICVVLNMPTYVAIKKPVIKTQPEIYNLLLALREFGIKYKKTSHKI